MFFFVYRAAKSNKSADTEPLFLYRDRSRSDASKPNTESNQNVLFNSKYDLNLSTTTTTVTTPTNGE